MPRITGNKGHFVFCGCSGDDSVTGSKAMGQGIRLDINQGAMPDIFRQWKHHKTERCKEIMDIILLVPAIWSLQKFEIGVNGKISIV